jgi:hypothetical protein
MEEYKCRVCGFEYDIPTWFNDNEATSDICICCGVEFGFDDTHYEAIIDYRKEWIGKGNKFHVPKLKPTSYQFQIENIPEKWK